MQRFVLVVLVGTFKHKTTTAYAGCSEHNLQLAVRQERILPERNSFELCETLKTKDPQFTRPSFMIQRFLRKRIWFLQRTPIPIQFSTKRSIDYNDSYVSKVLDITIHFHP